MRRLAVWGTFGLILFGVSCSSPEGSPSSTPARIALLSGQGNAVQLYTITVDGSELTKLTDLPGNKGPFAFSPDGRWLAFSTETDGDYDIYLMDMRNSKLTNLSQSPATSEYYATWSPDAQSLAFAVSAGLDEELRILSLDGTGTTIPLPPNLSFWPPDQPLAWSPDGNQVAFSAFSRVIAGEPNAHVYTVNRDGTNLKQLTDGPQVDDEPVWAAGGDKLYFRSHRDGNAEIYVVGKDGTGLANLSNNQAGDNAPMPSPDGRLIGFTSDRDGSIADLFVMNSDGTQQRNVSQGHGPITKFSWSLAGDFLAFAAREQDGSTSIYVVSAAGDSLRELTSGTGQAAYPQWVPPLR